VDRHRHGPPNGPPPSKSAIARNLGQAQLGAAVMGDAGWKRLIALTTPARSWAACAPAAPARDEPPGDHAVKAVGRSSEHRIPGAARKLATALTETGVVPGQAV